MDFDPWTLLDLPPGSPLPEIRRAYARKLKQIDADADPQGFQSLREAYETALKLAKGQAPALPLPAFAPPQEPDVTRDATGAEPPDVAPAAPGGDPQDARAFEDNAYDPELFTRIHRGDDLPNDALRLIDVLRDPRMADPHLASAVEAEIFGFLVARLNRAQGQSPTFRLGFAAPPALRASRHEARRLMEELDLRFGWFSDAVRMRDWRGYRDLQRAAQDLVPKPEVPTKVGANVKFLVIGLFVVAGLARALLNLADREPDPRQAVQAQIELLTKVQHATAAEISQDRDWLADPAKGGPSVSTRQILELSMDPDLQPPPDAAAGRLALDRLRQGPPEALSTLTWAEGFMAGMLYAHAYVLDQNLGYRITTPFQMTTARGQTLWTNSGADDRLWPGGAGYVVSMKSPEIGDTVALYPAGYIDALRAKAGGQVAIWQGALLVPPEVMAPGSRLYRIAAPDFPRADQLQISNSWSVLTLEAMSQNRWPIRAITLTEVPCAALEWGAGGFSALPGCP